MPAPIQIAGLDGWWQAVPQRYDVQADPLYCPVCGGVGIPWRGVYHCDGTCQAIASVATGQVFVPVASPVLPETYCWEP
jgi:hypothetical protein